MNPFERLKMALLAFLGVKEFAKDKNGKIELTEDQIKAIDEFKGEGFSSKFIEMYEKESAGSAELEALKKELETEKANGTASVQKVSGLEARIKELEELIKAKDESIAKLIELPEEDNKPKGGGKTVVFVAPSATDKFLFGQNLPYMAIDESRPYNMRAQAALLARQGIMLAVPTASSIDYTALKQDLGDFYRIQKQQQIQSFLMELPSLEKIFPLESGYQDRAVLLNLFLGEFSQADNSSSDFDNVVKGAYEIQPEELRMFDVMFAHKFRDLKQLEKSWIGYLNREGSSSIKWSFIQYLLVETGKKLHNEREMRRIKGVRKNPVLNQPGTAMGAADGFREFIRKKIAAFQIKPFALGEYTDTNIADYLYRGTALLPSWFRDTGKVVVYMSPDAVTKYHKNREALYGTNQDYKADIMYVAEYPNVRIQAVTGMDESKRIVWTLDGNFHLFEDQPGEMYRFQIEQQDWSVKVWSQWKESFWAIMVGYKFASAAEQDYDHQMIFCNDVDLGVQTYIPMDKDDVTPSALLHTSLVSVANAAATAITNIDDVATGQTIRLKCGNSVNPITIAKAGNFSLISAAWQPAVGDVIVLKKRADGKFIELERLNESSQAIAIAADDTTPDVAAGDTFVTNANTQATAITTLDNAEYDVVYTIYGAGAANASTIANAGSFVLTAAMTLSAGKWIKLQKSKADDKFYEIERSA